MNMQTVQETIHHGDTYQERFIDVDLDDLTAVTDMLNTCSYLRLPDPNFGKGAILVSRSYEQIVAQRTEDAKMVAQKLANNEEAEVGWVSYEVVEWGSW